MVSRESIRCVIRRHEQTGRYRCPLVPRFFLPHISWASSLRPFYYFREEGRHDRSTRRVLAHTYRQRLHGGIVMSDSIHPLDIGFQEGIEQKLGPKSLSTNNTLSNSTEAPASPSILGAKICWSCVTLNCFPDISTIVYIIEMNTINQKRNAKIWFFWSTSNTSI